MNNKLTLSLRMLGMILLAALFLVAVDSCKSNKPKRNHMKTKFMGK